MRLFTISQSVSTSYQKNRVYKCSRPLVSRVFYEKRNSLIYLGANDPLTGHSRQPFFSDKTVHFHLFVCRLTFHIMLINELLRSRESLVVRQFALSLCFCFREHSCFSAPFDGYRVGGATFPHYKQIKRNFLFVYSSIFFRLSSECHF